jgi:PAS domain S-box-containing protein
MDCIPSGPVSSLSTILGHNPEVRIVRIVVRKGRHEVMVRVTEDNQNPLRRLVSNLPGVIYRCANDADRTMAFISDGAQEISGYPASDFLGNAKRAFTSLIHPDDLPELRQVVDRALSERRPFAVDYRIITASQEIRWVYDNGQGVLDAEGALLHLEGAIFDVSDRKLTEEALQTAKHEAELANRSKSEFLANMTHELRTPLNAIIGFADLMTKEAFGPLGDSNYREYANDIQAAGQHLLDLISAILDLSKIEARKAELKEEERAQTGNVKLDARFRDEPLPALRADMRMLKQILINLLTNAVKFTPPGGKVTIRWWANLDDGFVFEVADTGIGMTREDIPKALARFGQVDGELNRQYEGAGLGLPLTKSLVELHGGSLKLQSKVNVGTRVTIRFPAERMVPFEEAASVAS